MVVDLGTGNGLPGIAAAIAWPTARVFLVERRQKKSEAVRRCLARVGFPQGEVLACDGREVVKVRPELHHGVDLVTVRAVGTLAETTKIAAPWLAPTGRIAHWKGRTLAEEEIRLGAATAQAAGLRALPALDFDDEAGPAHLLLYERPRRG